MYGVEEVREAGGSGQIFCVCKFVPFSLQGIGDTNLAHQCFRLALVSNNHHAGLQQPGRAGDAEGPRGAGQPASRISVDSLLASQSSHVQPFSHMTSQNELWGLTAWGLSPSIGSVTWTSHLTFQCPK